LVPHFLLSRWRSLIARCRLWPGFISACELGVPVHLLCIVSRHCTHSLLWYHYMIHFFSFVQQSI
jgi:hypothetical protein